MLNCILSMVEKTRRALGILQQRATNDNQLHQQKRRDSSTSSSSLIHHHQQVTTYEASELRRQAGELIAQTLKATEDRVSQVKRKAEEAVHDDRRAAMAELQRALSAERLRAERLAAEARRQGAEEALSALGQHAMMQSGGSHHHQTSSSPANKEVCWNCGRRANETCR
jgi:runt-related transcription factor 1